ncbi:hypothetical protein EVAR_78980_1 [Eumeta japonica]|uniref:Uncharacterized protein n=1 Tax=Eumeta variegata TaxID=151549 RepID=A0A4C1UTG9_EUMVA|nr:hypothetical protein EVAR_78980_1 [Eumeta japonica]
MANRRTRRGVCGHHRSSRAAAILSAPPAPHRRTHPPALAPDANTLLAHIRRSAGIVRTDLTYRWRCHVTRTAPGPRRSITDGDPAFIRLFKHFRLFKDFAMMSFKIHESVNLNIGCRLYRGIVNCRRDTDVFSLQIG